MLLIFQHNLGNSAEYVNSRVKYLGGNVDKYVDVDHGYISYIVVDQLTPTYHPTRTELCVTRDTSLRLQLKS